MGTHSAVYFLPKRINKFISLRGDAVSLHHDVIWIDVLHYTHITTVVDEPREVPALGGVYDGVEVDAEQVGAADARRLVVRLAHVRHYGAHHLTHVLYHHLVSGYRLLLMFIYNWVYFT